MRRLSGGNQQKVTIARWVAGGVQTMLCFDPTRGIDIRTKNQIYVLLRDLAEAGAAVLLYTSELKEIQLACDRAIVIFGGEVVAEIAAAERRRSVAAARGPQPAPDAALPEEVARAASGRRRPSSGRRARLRPESHRERAGRRSAARSASSAPGGATERLDAGPAGFLVAAARLHQAHPAELRRCAASRAWPSSVLPLALAAVAQAIVVIAGGIDLSIGSMMALTSVRRGRR